MSTQPDVPEVLKSVATRIITRYLVGALTALGLVGAATLSKDPEVQLIIGAVVAAGAGLAAKVIEAATVKIREMGGPT